MTKIKYKVSYGEDIGIIPHGAIINAYLFAEDEDSGAALIYFPKKVKWISEAGNKGTDSGCGSFSFGKLVDGFWRQTKNINYVNVATNKFEKMIGKKK